MKNDMRYASTFFEEQSASKIAIRLALLKLMENKNINKITVTEVAKEANINRKTFYHYFLDIEDAYEYILNGVSETYSEMFVESLCKKGNLDDFFEFKKENTQSQYIFFKKLLLSKSKNSLYEQIFREIDNRIQKKIIKKMQLTHEQLSTIKMIQYSVMLTFGDWILSNEKEISIDELTHFFKKIASLLLIQLSLIE